MKSFSRFSILFGMTLAFALGIAVGHFNFSQDRQEQPGTDSTNDGQLEPLAGQTQATYVCPMHAEIVSHEQGSCPICGMDLVPVKAETRRHADTDDDSVVSIAPEVINNLGVRTAPVERTTVIRRIEAPGFVQQIRKADTTRYTAPVDGTVEALLFDTQAWLESDAPLFEFRSPAILAAQQKHLALLSAGAESATPETPEADQQDNDTDGTQPEPTLTLEESRRYLGRLGMNKAAIEVLEENGQAGDSITFHSRHPGRAMELQVKQGAQVKAGDRLFELQGLVRASVLANAFQRDAAWIRTGQPVEVRMPHQSGVVWPGVVNQGSVSINPNTQNIGVRLSFTAPVDKVKSAMYVVATIFGEVKKNVLAVPPEAVMRGQTQDTVVLALGDGRFKPVEVRTGIETDAQVEILEGLEAGDEVVVSAQFLIDSESSLQAGLRRLHRD
jgi:Cu(I)/Ag(I) efflux system membrane fusion protein